VTGAARIAALRPLAQALGAVSVGAAADRVVVDADRAAQATDEEVFGLLGAQIAAGRLGSSDPAIAAQATAAYQAIAALGLKVEHATRPALTALDAAGIPVLVLKGAALWRTVYQPGERQVRDVDVIVHARDYERARAILRRLGLREDIPLAYPCTMAVFHQVELRTPDGVALDLHRRLAAWPLWPVATAALFRRARRVGGSLVPDPSDQLTMLAIHVAGDGFAFPLRTAMDGIRLVQAGASPEAVGGAARAWRARRATAAFVRVLLGLGGDGAFHAARWRALADDLAAARAMPPWRPPGAKGDARPGEQRWRDRAAIAQLCDEPARPVTYFTARGALRVGDRVAAFATARLAKSADGASG
jgi:hypothetical protein